MIALSQDELIIQNAAAAVGATAVIVGAHNAYELEDTPAPKPDDWKLAEILEHEG
jgi:hypothetical protein